MVVEITVVTCTVVISSGGDCYCQRRKEKKRRVLCCEHTIQGLNHLSDAIKTRWKDKIDQCINLNHHIATIYN